MINLKFESACKEHGSTFEGIYILGVGVTNFLPPLPVSRAGVPEGKKNWWCYYSLVLDLPKYWWCY